MAAPWNAWSKTPFLEAEYLVLNLNRGGFQTAAAVQDAINGVFGAGVALALDSTSIRVRAPSDPSDRVAFMGMLEQIDVEPAGPAAQVIVNARTGTVVHRRPGPGDARCRLAWLADRAGERGFQRRSGRDGRERRGWRGGGAGRGRW